MIIGLFLWLGILVFLATSIWGGIFWAVLWLFIGGGIIALIVGLVSLPARLLGGVLVSTGESLLEDVAFDVPLAVCEACGSSRASDDDQFCRECGSRYG